MTSNTTIVTPNETTIFRFNDLRFAFSNNRLITGLAFIDHPELKALFDQHYEVLTAAQLAEPLVRQAKAGGPILLNENDLNEVELQFMDYFQAQTVGDLVFNYWD